jgi:hypothetical protein
MENDHVYRRFFPYHFAAWLQGHVSQAVFQELGGCENDLKLLKEKAKLELIWSQLSTKLKLELSQSKVSACTDLQHHPSWQSDLDNVMEQLKTFELLEVAEKTRLMDKAFPEVASVPGQYANNLLVYQNFGKGACSMMSGLTPGLV